MKLTKIGDSYKYKGYLIKPMGKLWVVDEDAWVYKTVWGACRCIDSHRMMLKDAIVGIESEKSFHETCTAEEKEG